MYSNNRNIINYFIAGAIQHKQLRQKITNKITNKMAFDRPIEADRVDDLGLLSTFVRAPILGPVMWILGKKLLPDEKTEKGENDHKLIEECAVSTSPGDAFTLKNSSEKYPDLASSSISDIIDEPSVDDIDCNESEYHRRRKPVVDSEETKLNETPHPLQRMKKKSRKMSWSDESGQNLVEYCDVVSSIINLSSWLLANTQSICNTVLYTRIHVIQYCRV